MQDNQPLWMPKGSIRGALAAIVVVGYVVSVLASGLDDVPVEVVMAVLGFYFLERKGN